MQIPQLVSETPETALVYTLACEKLFPIAFGLRSRLGQGFLYLVLQMA